MKRKFGLGLPGSLTLPAKFAILGGIALLLAAVPTWRYYETAQDDIDFSLSEAGGLPAAQATLKLMRAVQYQRMLLAEVSAGSERAVAEFAARQQEAEQAAAAIDQATASMGSKPLSDRWADARSDWARVAAAAKARGADADRTAAGFDALGGKLAAVLESVVDESKMALDPDATRYFAIQGTLVELPALSGQFAALGAAAADRGRLEVLAASSEEHVARVAHQMEKVFVATPASRARLEPGLRETSEMLRRAIDFARGSQAAPAAPAAQAALRAAVAPALDRQYEYAQAGIAFLGEELGHAAAQTRSKQMLTLGQEIVLMLVALAGAGLVVRSITKPVERLLGAVRRLDEGDEEARANLGTDDEIGRLGSAFDRMMDVRIANLRRENEQLNNSVLGLLQAVAQLARKDLTVKVPVTADVTGSVADALNLLTGETAKVLQQVSDISADVTAASLQVKSKSDSVVRAAEQEREQIDRTASSLEEAARTMTQIATMAQDCNASAARAITTTQQALSTVTDTVGGINGTRDTIRETEKRIKRLGERSQEISVAVNLINSIAERTHILALNAAMHAASAGEAGRGFAVVADEVQRLAENARQATQQIATLVGNIQSETSDTVHTMNAAISQVVEGSKLAEQAGRQMEVTQRTTAELVSSVQRIAEQSQQQARSTTELLERAALIKRSTQETSQQLSEQSQQTNLLVDYARNLLATVRVFKLSST